MATRKKIKKPNPKKKPPAPKKAAPVIQDGEGTVDAVCFEHGCYSPAVDWVGDFAYCQEHMPQPEEESSEAVDVATEMVEQFKALAEQEDRVAAAADRLQAVFEGKPEPAAAERREPEHHVHVPPPPGPRPELPVLQPHLLEFHTVRRGLLCDVAFTIFEDVVIRRVHDRLAGGSTYSLAGAADLDTEQDGGEITSHYWHQATNEEHDALAACDPDEPPAERSIA